MCSTTARTPPTSGPRAWCYLAWGGDGEEIAAALRRAGLAVEWDGTPHQRMWVELA